MLSGAASPAPLTRHALWIIINFNSRKCAFNSPSVAQGCSEISLARRLEANLIVKCWAGVRLLVASQETFVVCDKTWGQLSCPCSWCRDESEVWVKMYRWFAVALLEQGALPGWNPAICGWDGEFESTNHQNQLSASTSAALRSKVSIIDFPASTFKALVTQHQFPPKLLPPVGVGQLQGGKKRKNKERPRAPHAVLRSGLQFILIRSYFEHVNLNVN